MRWLQYQVYTWICILETSCIYVWDTSHNIFCFFMATCQWSQNKRNFLVRLFSSKNNLDTCRNQNRLLFVISFFTMTISNSAVNYFFDWAAGLIYTWHKRRSVDFWWELWIIDKIQFCALFRMEVDSMFVRILVSSNNHSFKRKENRTNSNLFLL